MRPPRPELLSLLQTAREASLHDSGPRLVIADWLEEHGDEADRARAELLRLDLFNGRWANADYDTRQARRKELLARYERAWLAPFLAAKARRAYIELGLVTGV